jgi:MoaA/NifB/PqqE/SkfB family radical SAM enzyme
MTPGEIRELFARSGGFSWVDATGGEIFLRDDLPEIFDAILDGCRRLAMLHFPTNGYRTDRIVEVVRGLMRRKPPRVAATVSVDGPPAVHDALRGVPGSFERAVETYARLREIPGCRTFLGMTLSEANLGTAGELLAAVRRRVPRATAADLHVNLPHRSSHYYRNDDCPFPEAEALREELRSIRRLRGCPGGLAELVERRLLSLGDRYLRTGRCPVPCAALASGCFVDARGTVFPCVSWSRPLGSLRENGFDIGRVWNSAEAFAARGEIVAGRCPHCWTACESVPSLAANPGRWIG